MQSSEIRSKTIGKRYVYDDKSFDSADELAMYIWLKDNKV